ncbi:hypothetical protein T492DRAFT_320539 [Pavlovales sp. CCMP2436]|nr:hypothetical protein T492DRAFT_320539 [Pavlovales sp. CCMP2436]
MFHETSGRYNYKFTKYMRALIRVHVGGRVVRFEVSAGQTVADVIGRARKLRARYSPGGDDGDADSLWKKCVCSITQNEGVEHESGDDDGDLDWSGASASDTLEPERPLETMSADELRALAGQLRAENARLKTAAEASSAKRGWGEDAAPSPPLGKVQKRH